MKCNEMRREMQDPLFIQLHQLNAVGVTGELSNGPTALRRCAGGGDAVSGQLAVEEILRIGGRSIGGAG